MVETLRLQELLHGCDFNTGMVEAILASHQISNVSLISHLKGDFLNEVLETATAVSKAPRLRPGLTDAITKLGETVQTEGNSNCGATAVCLTAGCVTDGGVTADGMTAGTLTDQSLLNPFPGVTAAAKALEALTAAEENGMDRWRIDEALKELYESQRLASESAVCAGRALKTIDEFPNPKQVIGVPNEKQPLEVIKRAKLVVRDAYMWRCMGLALGMDSQLAMERIFKSTYSGQGRAQIIQSFTKIRESTAKLLTGTGPKIPATGAHAKRVRERKEDPFCKAATQTEIAPPPGLTLLSSSCCTDLPTPCPSFSSTEALSTILQRYIGPDFAPDFPLQ
jgi:hypothetical protein